MRHLFAAVLLVAAAFLAMNRVVANSALGDWLLPLALLVVGAALIPNWQLGIPDRLRGASEPVTPVEPLPSGTRSYTVTATPRPHTMTIRPDPELEQYVVAVTDDATGAVLPFMDAEAVAQTEEMPAAPSVSLEPDVTPTPVSPETPAPAVEPEPAPEVVPVSPETPAPAAPEAPVIESPETPGGVSDQEPSQGLPVSTTPAPEHPTPEPKFTARSEYVNPDESVAHKEPPAAPPPTDAVTAPQRTEPEKDVVAEKTAAPQQPYEAEQLGTLTPEQVDRTMNQGEPPSPAMSQPASPAVAAQERSGEGVGSADDLTRLNGIGAKSASALKAAGIDSYHKLANSTNDAIRAALTTGGVRLVGDVETWAQQAGYAARGDWDGLRQFNAGRKTTIGD
jgi:predicted flap endonuclease-1-like 5' DNA nuclease